MKVDVVRADAPPSGRRPRWKAIAVLVVAFLICGGALAALVSFALDDRPSRGEDQFDLATFNIKTPQGRAALEATVRDWTATNPEQLKPVSSEDAARLNAELPVSSAKNPPASPLALSLGDRLNHTAGVDCLTEAVYYEAANEPIDGQRAVAQVILNRVRHPAYPKTICGVVYQGVERGRSCQFTFVCDGALARAPVPALWRRAREVALAALSGLVYAPAGLATHYHADYVFPYWAPTLVKSLVIGRHLFYRMPGGLGSKAAFNGQYQAAEWSALSGARVRERALLMAMATDAAQLPETGNAAAPALLSQERGVLMPNGALAGSVQGNAAAPGKIAPSPAAPAPTAIAPGRYVLGTDGGTLK
ncbi:cell wall hydrolase [Sphingobium olei]|uniref:Cell wall hydrolase n=1 Tax=Sphingobium olei TaxID=420955 RepID=A0ABW3P718_9SPHN|nr:cell wall hydrolase [Sphingobium sp.]